jgi:murein DD-endopeptidase MepM/ murein hydrolase activator NlpD
MSAKADVVRLGPQAAPASLAWSAPLDRMRISSFYGAASALRGHPHGGIDIAARRGTPVHAPADGIVDAVTDRWQGQAKYGKVIVLRHGDDMQTLYAHLDKQVVKLGVPVAKGDIIGYTGATGRATGPHLHFEVWDRGAQVDPETVLGSLTANATANALKGRAAVRIAKCQCAASPGQRLAPRPAPQRGQCCGHSHA